MNVLRSRIVAIVEVVVVLAIYRVGLVPWVFPRLVVDPVARVFVNYLAMIAVPLLVILARRERLADYGIHLRGLRSQVNIGLTACIPYAVMMAISSWLLPMYFPKMALAWYGALINIAFDLAVFWVVVQMVRNKPVALAPALLLPLALVNQQNLTPVTERLLAFVYYLVLVGPGEEIFFRGYMQTRLNRVFGCPYTFGGASYGWGALLTCLLFGAMHVFNGYTPLAGSISFSPWWGVGAAFAALVFAYLREKTGSIVSPAILHGLPQAIAALMLGFFAIR